MESFRVRYRRIRSWIVSNLLRPPHPPVALLAHYPGDGTVQLTLRHASDYDVVFVDACRRIPKEPIAPARWRSINPMTICVVTCRLYQFVVDLPVSRVVIEDPPLTHLPAWLLASHPLKVSIRSMIPGVRELVETAKMVRVSTHELLDNVTERVEVGDLIALLPPTVKVLVIHTLDRLDLGSLAHLRDLVQLDISADTATNPVELPNLKVVSVDSCDPDSYVPFVACNLTVEEACFEHKRRWWNDNVELLCTLTQLRELRLIGYHIDAHFLLDRLPLLERLWLDNGRCCIPPSSMERNYRGFEKYAPRLRHYQVNHRVIVSDMLASAVHEKGSADMHAAEECIFCMEVHAEAELTRGIFVCDHAWHPKCIEPWLETRATCPYCRQPLRPRSGINWTREQAISILMLSHDLNQQGMSADALSLVTQVLPLVGLRGAPIVPVETGRTAEWEDVD